MRILSTGWQSTSFPRMQHRGLLCRRRLEAEFPIWGCGPPFLPSYFLQPCQYRFCAQRWDINYTSIYLCMAQWVPMPGWPYALFASAIRRNSDMHKLDLDLSVLMAVKGMVGWLVLCRMITYFITFYS